MSFDDVYGSKNPRLIELAHDNVDCHVVEFQYTGFQPIKALRRTIEHLHVLLKKFVHHFRTLSAELPFFRWVVARSLKAIKTQWNLKPASIHCYNTFAWQGVSQFLGESTRIGSLHRGLRLRHRPAIMKHYDVKSFPIRLTSNKEYGPNSWLNYAIGQNNCGDRTTQCKISLKKISLVVTETARLCSSLMASILKIESLKTCPAKLG